MRASLAVALREYNGQSGIGLVEVYIVQDP
jgi:hypothetical protein